MLTKLPTAEHASFDSSARQHERECLTNTRVELLSRIYKWANADDSPAMFWLNGWAGTGKSTIAQTVARNCHTTGKLAASFFFSTAFSDTNHAGMFITSIAVQFANCIPGLKSKVQKAIAKHGDIVNKSLNHQWDKLIIGPLSSFRKETCRTKYVLVVDALDECDDRESIQIVLQRLADLQSLKHITLRVFLTSRPELHIQDGFGEIQGDRFEDFVLHRIESLAVSHDIAVFFRHQLRPLGKKWGLAVPWPQEKDVSRLVQNSSGLFIWAATACRFIGADSRLAEGRLSSLLKQECNGQLPPERRLDEIYTTVLAKSIQGEYSDAESQVLYEQFRRVVGPIIMLRNPLSITSLAELLGEKVAMLKSTLTSLSSVIDVSADDSNALGVLHPSFREFLLSRDRCLRPQFFIDEKLVHCQIYKRCLQVLLQNLRRNMCDLKDPGPLTDNLDMAKVKSHIQPHVRYACQSWLYHYLSSDISVDSYFDLVRFFRKHLLHWIESLALLGNVSDAVAELNRLESTLNPVRIHNVQRLIING